MYDVRHWEETDEQIDNIVDILYKYVGFKTNGVFVEVGGFDCRQWSPSYPLAKHYGWSGVYFEPQPDLAAKCRRNHGPNVTIIEKAISNYTGRATLFLGGSISTIVEQERDLYMSIPVFACTGHADGKTVEVDVAILGDELTKAGIHPGFDLLVIDVEGAEVDVLSVFDISYWRPTIVAVETRKKYWDHRLAAQAPWVDSFMQCNGYREIQADHINSVYVRHVEATGEN